MEKTSRTLNSMRNITTGTLKYSAILILNFISRTVFIKTLGTEYLGINGLFSNILTILSLADLGIEEAVIYSMYKPLAENNTKKIAALTNFFRKIYTLIAIAIAIIGSILIPFLGILINTDTQIEHLTLYYILLLANAITSYICASRIAVINADQKQYIPNLYTLICNVIRTILQIIVLCLTKSFLIYLMVQIPMTLITNILITKKANKLYPYIKEKEEIAQEDKKKIFSNIKSMFLYKLGGIILNNTDNILISIMVGTVYVGYYSNYTLIISAVTSFTDIIFKSVMSSIGNLNATADSNKKYEMFKILKLVATWVYNFCAICLLVLFNDFISLWIGGEYILDTSILITVVINFYMCGIFNAIAIFRDTVGMFKKTRYVFLITAILNIIFSIIFGKVFGLLGIILATAIARTLTNMWYEPTILYKEYFRVKPIQYFKDTLKGVIELGLVLLVVCIFTLPIKTTSIFTFIIKVIICMVIPNLIYFVIHRKSKEFKYIYEKILRVILEKLKLNRLFDKMIY